MDNEKKHANETAEQRKERLAAELRANLYKRKAQARARARPVGSPPPRAGRDNESPDAS